MSSSSSESEHEDDTSVGSIFVVEEFIDDDDLEAMVEMASLTDLPGLGAAILKGGVKGRVVVDVNA